HHPSFSNDPPTPQTSPLSLHDALPISIDRYDRPFGTAFPDGREQWDVAAGRIPMISWGAVATGEVNRGSWDTQIRLRARGIKNRSEEHTSELQSPCNLVCRLLLEKKKK